MEYSIEFSKTVYVEADNEDEAVDEAIKQIAADDKIYINDCYIYCNGKQYG